MIPQIEQASIRLRNREKEPSYTIWVLSQLLENGAIKKEGDKVQVDSEEAVKILRLLVEDSNDNKSVDVKEGHLDIQSVKEALREVIGGFIEESILDQKTVEGIGLLLTEDNVVVTKNDYHRFLYLQDTLPQQSDERAVLEVGEPLVKQHIGILEEMLQSAGVTFNQEDLLRVALRWSIAHEYGHAIQTYMLLLRTGRRYQSSDKKLWEVALELEDEMVNYLQEIAPFQEVLDLLKYEPEDGIYVSLRGFYSESIAVGFELVGLMKALKTVFDISEEKIEEVMALRIRDIYRRRNQLSDFINFARTKQLGIEEIGTAVTELSLDLRDRGYLDLRNSLPLSFGIRTWGYVYPLSRKQLLKLVERYKS